MLRDPEPMTLSTLHSIVMPDIGAENLPMQVCSWLVELGEQVREGDRLVEVSLPGLTFDVSSPAAGRLSAIDKCVGTDVQPGDVLGKITLQTTDSL